MILFSIIIPVYKVEDCIRKSLESIFSQDIDESIYEVVIVNDGTPDNSMQIVEEFHQKHNNIIIINKENGGVSSARNVGIKAAQGKYIVFVDADDYLSDGSLEKIVYCVNNISFEVLVLRSFMDSRNDEVYRWQDSFKENNKYRGIDIIDSGYSRGSVCGCVFNKNFLNRKNILFPESVANSEDSIFMTLCMLYAIDMQFRNIHMYNVYEREGSASRSYTIDRVAKMTLGLDFVQNYIVEHRASLTNIQLDILNHLKYRIISDMTVSSLRVKSLSYKKLIQKTGIKKWLPININLLRLSRIKIRILNTSYRLFYLMVKIKYSRKV